MSDSVQTIVDKHCCNLLNEMRNAHHDAPVGISVALFYPGDSSVPQFFQYGLAGQGIDITPTTVYAIGSVTKVFTATLAAYLNVQGMIGDLGQTPVRSYLVNPQCQGLDPSSSYWETLSFLQLATQTSGMPDTSDGHYGNQLFADQPPSCAQFNWWNNNVTAFEQHEGSWIYSNPGFVTLGFAVARAAQQHGLANDYTTLLKNVVTIPLEMPLTFAADDVPAGAVLAQGYDKNSSPVLITREADLKTSASDILKFLTALYDAMQLQASGASLTPLQQALVETAKIWIAHPMQPNHTPTPFAMGLGWQIPTIGSTQVLVKNGATSRAGCSCWVGLTSYSSKKTAVGIALMTNQIGVPPDQTARAILTQIIG